MVPAVGVQRELSGLPIEFCYWQDRGFFYLNPGISTHLHPRQGVPVQLSITANLKSHKVPT